VNGKSNPAERLFGRDADLAVVRSFIGQTASQGCVLLLSGEPGVGKTALLYTAEGMAGTRPVTAGRTR